MRTIIFVAFMCALIGFGGAVARSAADTSNVVRLPAGTYLPFYARESAKSLRRGKAPYGGVSVESFVMDRYPVTNGEFLEFVKQNPRWRRSEVKPIFADAHYLDHWSSDLVLRDPADADRPVTDVSWFAAQAYCSAQGKTLPTTDQWEYALADGQRNTTDVRSRILAWYAEPDTRELPHVRPGTENGYGVADLVGLIWEWTLDFNSVMSSADLRGSDARFCGGASLGASDPNDSASFMRYSLRASLKAAYTTKNLGFRCAASLS